MRTFKPFAREIISVLSVVIFLLVIAPRAGAQQTFSYPNFSSLTGLQPEGDYTLPEGTTVFRLTQNTTSQVSSLWYTNPSAPAPSAIPLSLGFTTTFSFQITNPGGLLNNGRVGADGFAFVVQNGTFNGYGGDNSGGVTALGPHDGAGGELGYTGLTNSVAVQFDTWANVEYGDTYAAAGSPTSADEISIQSCGATANTVNHAAGCTFGRIDLSTLAHPIYIADGQSHTAQISYDPPSTPDVSCTPANASLSSPGCGSLTVIVDGQTVLTSPFSLAYLNIGASDNAFVGFTGATGGSDEDEDLVSWSFSANVTSTVSQPINTAAPPNLSAVFSPNTGSYLAMDMDFTTSTGITSPINNPVLLTINNAVSQSKSWPMYDSGTPWSVSLCTIKAGNGIGDFCSLFVNECYDSTLGPSTASDANCPYVTEPSDSNFITLKDIFDWQPKGKIQPLPGTTISLIDFTPAAGNPSESWGASNAPVNPVCTNVSGVVNNSTNPPTITPVQCDISDTLVDVYGDQTTTRGGKPKKGWLISVYNVPMLQTTVEAKPNPNDPHCPLKQAVVLNNPGAAVWNNGACLLDFVVNPAVPPAGLQNLNGFQAAPPATFYYGPGTPALVPGPIPNTDTAYYNPNPVLTCPAAAPAVCVASPWDTGVNAPLSILGAEGAHPIHWSSKDTVGIAERNIQLISSGLPAACHNPDNDPLLAPPCYNTDYFTTNINIDNTAATIAASFSTPGNPAGLFALNQVVYPVYTCTDALSGVAVCGDQNVAACPLAPPSLTSGTALNTSTPGPHSYQVTATDCAGNVSQALTVNYSVAPPANVAIFEQRTSDYPKQGGTLNYIVWALDLTRNTPAYDVVITFQVPALPGVAGGPITGTVADVSCNLLVGCSAMPPSGGGACSTSPGPNGGTTVTCNVGTLASIWNLAGAKARLSIPISATAKVGTNFKISATVSSGDDPNPKNNFTADSITVTSCQK